MILKPNHLNLSLDGNRLMIHWPYDSAINSRVIRWASEYQFDDWRRSDVSRGFTALQIHPDDIDRHQLQELLDAAKASQLGTHWTKEVFDIFKRQQKERQARKEALKHLKHNYGPLKLDQFKVPLYPWQVSGYKFLECATKFDKGAAIFDQMGLGKTFTVNALLNLHGQKRVVVCPAGIRIDWHKKTQLLQDTSTYIIDENYPQGCEDAEVIIVSYAYLKTWSWYLAEVIKKQKRVIVFDEAQYIRNPEAQRTKISIYLSELAKYCIVISGTPIYNRPGDLWPLLVVTRRLWGDFTYEGFVRRHESPSGHKKIRNRLKGFMIRRLKEDVWEQAPEKTVGTTWINLSNEDEYKSAENNFIHWLTSQGASEAELDNATRGLAFVKMNHLRQMAIEGKMESFIEIIRNTLDSGEKVVVFCTFRKPLMMLQKHFAKYKSDLFEGTGLVTGKTPEKVRDQIREAFQNGKLGAIFTSRTGAEGQDLTAAALEYQLDLPWTAAAFEQSADRIHRIGQKRAVQIMKALAPNTIDEDMDNRIVAKAEMAAACIGDDITRSRVKSASIVNEMIQGYFNRAAKVR